MSTPVYFGTESADISGYLKAYIGARGPTATLATTVGLTTTASATVVTSTTFVPMTLTSGGTVAAWITPPLAAAVTISTAPFVSMYGAEANAAANAKIGVSILKYSAGAEGTAFIATSTAAVELLTTMSRNAWVTTTSGASEAITSTSFAAGDRMVLRPGYASVGTMATGYGLFFDYAGPVSGGDGDSYVLFNENFNAATSFSQYAASAAAIAGGPSIIAYQQILDVADPVVKALLGSDARWADVVNEIQAQQTNATA